MMTKRAVLYARVSSDDQDRDGRNLAGQLEMAREYAQKKGYAIVAELAEDDRGASGASFELPKLGEVLEMAEASGFDVLVPREIDRLSRNLAKQLIVEEELKRMGVVVDYVLGDYPDTPEGRLNKHIRATIAEYEREKIVERMARGRRLKVKAGNVMVNGLPPYGYDPAEVDGKSTLVINEKEAKIVRLVYQWYIEGDDDGQRMSLAAIARKLTEMGIPTYMNSRDVKAVNDRPRATRWSTGSVRKMLVSETYAGTWYWGKGNGPSRKPRSAWVPVEVPAIVSRTTWKAAQKRLAEQTSIRFDAMDEDFSPRRQLVEILDLRATLAVRNGERVVYVSCHLGDDQVFVCCATKQSPKCGNNNEPLDKGAAFLILSELLRGG